MIYLRKSSERGHFDHGWLKSFHSFSFANYYDRNHMQFGNLRVINEDFIAPQTGFGMHPHADMEIITYVISGAISHRDSMNNAEKIRAGELQVMSAGTGIVHSEFNLEEKEETHLLQIWIKPKIKGIAPRYQQKSFEEKFNDLLLVVSGDGRNNSMQINQDAEIYLAKFAAGAVFSKQLQEDKKYWLQMIKGEIFVSDSSQEFLLKQGDAVAIAEENSLEIKVSKDAEFLLFVL